MHTHMCLSPPSNPSPPPPYPQNPGEVGLKLNANTINLDTTTLYQSGRHFTGLGVGFLIFSIFYQDIEIPHVTARTRDGLSINIQPSFQFKLPVDNAKKLSALYLAYGKDYKQSVLSILESSTRDVISAYDAYDLVSERQVVATALSVDLDSRLTHMNVDIKGYQLLSILWDLQIDAKIMEAVVANEDIATAQAEKAISEIEGATSVQEAQILSETTIVTANMTASILKSASHADRDIIVLQGTAQSSAYKGVMANVTGMTSQQLLKYVYLDQVMGGSYGRKKISVDVPGVVQTELETWT